MVSKWLQQRILRQLFYIFIGIVSLGVALGILLVGIFPGIWYLAPIIIFLEILAFVVSRDSIGDLFRAISGVSGETRVEHLLETLPAGFVPAADINLFGKSNIDFVVIGRTGVWAIDAKNDHAGEIGFQDGQLTRTHGNFPKNKDYLAQASRNAEDLQKYLKETSGKEYPVKSVIAFTYYGVEVPFNFNPFKQKNNLIYVVRAGRLCELVTREGNPPLSRDEVRNLIRLVRQKTSS